MVGGLGGLGGLVVFVGGFVEFDGGLVGGFEVDLTGFYFSYVTESKVKANGMSFWNKAIDL